MARDYKHAKRSTANSSGATTFFLGLGLGLAAAFGVHLYHQKTIDELRAVQTAPPGTAEKSTDSDAPAARPGDQFDFYEELPKFEVVVPEREKEVRGNAGAPRVEKPGAYVLQAGSYRNFADADRVKALLALQGVTSKVEKVTIDTDTWHRVRIGPIRDLKSLEDTRRKLREVQIDAIVIKVGD